MEKNAFIKIIKQYGFPQMVLTRHMRSFIGAEISSVTKGTYNHFCWLINENTIASQDLIFKIVSLDTYLQGLHIVKFVTDTRWTLEAKARILEKINTELKYHWWKRRYDPLAILGQWLGWKWLQDPKADICSDKIKFIKDEDPDYNLVFPNPTDVNEYQKIHQATPENNMQGYLVTGRWLPEDL